MSSTLLRPGKAPPPPDRQLSIATQAPNPTTPQIMSHNAGTSLAIATYHATQASYIDYLRAPNHGKTIAPYGRIELHLSYTVPSSPSAPLYTPSYTIAHTLRFLPTSDASPRPPARLLLSIVAPTLLDLPDLISDARSWLSAFLAGGVDVSSGFMARAFFEGGRYSTNIYGEQGRVFLRVCGCVVRRRTIQGPQRGQMCTACKGVACEGLGCEFDPGRVEEGWRVWGESWVGWGD